jgi:5'-nucleotidase
VKSVVLGGDFNSYAMEDPLRILYDAGFANVEQHFGNGEYSYSFSGLSGSLDHILVNDAALARSTGTDIWNINSGESLALEYSRYNYHGTDFHAAGPYRSSDHDPVIVGLDLGMPPTLEVELSHDTLWPANHRYVTVTADVTAADDSGETLEVTLVSVTSNEPDDGEDDGSTVNDIVILSDTEFQLRAERSGSGAGRVYTVTYSVTDSDGYTTTATATVTVPLSKGR